MYVCMDVWMYGCMDVWMYGCMDGWMSMHTSHICGTELVQEADLRIDGAQVCRDCPEPVVTIEHNQRATVVSWAPRGPGAPYTAVYQGNKACDVRDDCLLR